MGRGSILECCQGAVGGCGAVLLVILVIAVALSSLALGIADIVVGVKWNECHMNDRDADIYLIVSGAVTLATLVVGNINRSTKQDENDPGRYALMAGLLTVSTFGILCWGMDVVWDQEQGDCSKGQFDYLYYRTIVVMFTFVASLALLLLVLLGGAFIGGAGSCREL